MPLAPYNRPTGGSTCNHSHVASCIPKQLHPFPFTPVPQIRDWQRLEQKREYDNCLSNQCGYPLSYNVTRSHREPCGVTYNRESCIARRSPTDVDHERRQHVWQTASCVPMERLCCIAQNAEAKMCGVLESQRQWRETRPRIWRTDPFAPLPIEQVKKPGYGYYLSRCERPARPKQLLRAVDYQEFRNAYQPDVKTAYRIPVERIKPKEYPKPDPPVGVVTA